MPRIPTVEVPAWRRAYATICSCGRAAGRGAARNATEVRLLYRAGRTRSADSRLTAAAQRGAKLSERVDESYMWAPERENRSRTLGGLLVCRVIVHFLPKREARARRSVLSRPDRQLTHV
jgi:hypothetical protein